MAKYQCSVCGAPAENPQCWKHKPKKPLKSGTKLRAKPKTLAQMLEREVDVAKMWAFFDYLWNKLPPKKFCWACKAPIYGDNRSLYWDHLVEKSVFPELKYKEENMFFCCADCHSRKTAGFPHPVHAAAIAKAREYFGIL